VPAFSLHGTIAQTIARLILPGAGDNTPIVVIVMLAVLFVILIGALMLPLDPTALQPVDIVGP
jgi:hypothetical protein